MRSRLSLDILYNLKEILHVHRYKNRRSWWARMLFGGLQYWSLLLLVFGRSFLSGIFNCRLGLPLQRAFVDRAFLFGICCPHSLLPFQSQFVSRSVPLVSIAASWYEWLSRLVATSVWVVLILGRPFLFEPNLWVALCLCVYPFLHHLSGCSFFSGDSLSWSLLPLWVTFTGRSFLYS